MWWGLNKSNLRTSYQLYRQRRREILATRRWSGNGSKINRNRFADDEDGVEMVLEINQRWDGINVRVLM